MVFRAFLVFFILQSYRKLPLIAWIFVVGNAIVMFYVTIFPGFKVADQSAIPANTKGMFTFDGK